MGLCPTQSFDAQLTWRDDVRWISWTDDRHASIAWSAVHPIFDQRTCYKKNLSEALRLISTVHLPSYNGQDRSRSVLTSQIIKTYPERSMKIQRTPFRAFYNASTCGLISHVRSRSNGRNLCVTIHSLAVSSGPLIELNASIGWLSPFRPINRRVLRCFYVFLRDLI